MSKAFTKESDTEETEAEVTDSPDPLPQGFKNYVTPRGLALLRDEFQSLRQYNSGRAGAQGCSGWQGWRM